MKIPHCSTSATRRGVTVKELLDDLATSGFTGYCAIPFGESITSLVFEGGLCLLAEHLGQQGLAGLQKLAVMGDTRVDAALCDFTTTQIGVTLKLNDRCRVVLPPSTPAAVAGRVPRSTSVTSVKIAGLGTKPIRVTSVRTSGEAAGRQAGGARAQGQGQILKRKIDRTDQRINKSSLESLKTLKDSFKTDAADLLEELNLGHLVVKGQPKNAGKEEEKR